MAVWVALVHFGPNTNRSKYYSLKTFRDNTETILDRVREDQDISADRRQQIELT